MGQCSAHVIIQFNKTSHFLKAIKHVNTKRSQCKSNYKDNLGQKLPDECLNRESLEKQPVS